MENTQADMEATPTMMPGVMHADHLRKPFAHHAPTDEQIENIARIRKGFADLNELMHSLAPYSRELSTAVTKLEEACMWAIKAAVINDPRSQITPI